MLQLTDKAIDKVQQALEAQGPEEGFVGVRVAVEGGGCSGFQYAMKLERQQNDGDHVVEFNGLKVLVDPQSMIYLDGTSIDYVETVQGEGFKFENPNAKSSCGCGESHQF